VRKALTVARWEYLERIKSKAFIISLFLMPVIMVTTAVLPTLLASRPDTESKVIAVIDQSGEFADKISHALADRFVLPNGQPNYILRPIPDDPSGEIAGARRLADSLVISGEIEGYVILPKSMMTDTTVEYRSENIGNFKITERLTGVIREVITERRLRERGFDPQVVKELTSPIELKTIKLSKTGQEEEAGFAQVFFTAYVFMMMMFFLVMTSGQILVRSILEEKSNRVIEVLLSSCRPRDLMTGKILGLSGLALTQMGFWVAIGLVVSVKLSITLVPLGTAILLGGYFVLGYLLYASIFVAAGAPVSSEQEAQQINSYLVLILVIPIVVAFVAVQNPNSTLIRILSFIPVLTASMMVLRIPIQMPSVLEIILTMAVLAVSGIGGMWLAGKVFRTTMLLYGKRPSLRELVSLVRSRER